MAQKQITLIVRLAWLKNDWAMLVYYIKLTHARKNIAFARNLFSFEKPTSNLDVKPTHPEASGKKSHFLRPHFWIRTEGSDHRSANHQGPSSSSSCSRSSGAKRSPSPPAARTRRTCRRSPSPRRSRARRGAAWPTSRTSSRRTMSRSKSHRWGWKFLNRGSILKFRAGQAHSKAKQASSWSPPRNGNFVQV